MIGTTSSGTLMVLLGTYVYYIRTTSARVANSVEMFITGPSDIPPFPFCVANPHVRERWDHWLRNRELIA